MGDVAAALTWPLTRPLTQPGDLMYVPSSRVRRCLFGPVDHDKCKLELEDGYKQMFLQDKQRWNFDFEHGKPLPSGRYNWEKVGDPSDADSNGGSVTQEKTKSAKREQTQITDFMRKRKSSNEKDSSTQRPKTRRRSST